MEHHLQRVINTKRAELAYLRQALYDALTHGTRAEQLHTLSTLEAVRIELRAYESLLQTITEGIRD